MGVGVEVIGSPPSAWGAKPCVSGGPCEGDPDPDRRAPRFAIDVYVPTVTMHHDPVGDVESQAGSRPRSFCRVEGVEELGLPVVLDVSVGDEIAHRNNECLAVRVRCELRTSLLSVWNHSKM